MVKPATKERRATIRAKRVLSIQYRLSKSRRKSADTGWHLSTTHDMSVGGLSFITDAEYKVGDTLELHVVMSGVLDIFNGNGKVVRVEKKKTGAFFLVAIKFIQSSKPRTAKNYRTKSTTKKKSTKRI